MGSLVGGDCYVCQLYWVFFFLYALRRLNLKLLQHPTPLCQKSQYNLDVYHFSHSMYVHQALSSISCCAWHETAMHCHRVFFFVAPLDKKLPIVIRLIMAHRGQYQRVSCCQPGPLIFVNLGHWLQYLKIRVELGRSASSCHKLARSLNKSVQSSSKWNGNILILQLQLQVAFLVYSPGD
jgi:hypothetical protein